jgi:hypothetical protein
VARKFLYIVAGAVVLVLLGALALRLFPEPLTRLAFEPGHAFEPQPALPADAYAARDLWLAHPAAAGAPGAPAVFFVHPVSYIDRAHWNAPLHPDAATEQRSRDALRTIAAAFAAGDALWAPRYRQPTFGAVVSDQPAARQAEELAYGDVLAAFDRFLAEVAPDRPLVLVGHSAGAALLKRVLKDRVAGQPLSARVAAAYVLGAAVSPAHDLPALGLPACASASQPGCVMSWMSFAEPADPTMFLRIQARRMALDGSGPVRPPFLCTNPLTGGGAPSAPASANPGTLLADGRQAARLVPARCSADGLLLVGPPPAMGPLVLPGNNYHVYDVALFWAAVHADMARRVAAWRVRM